MSEIEMKINACLDETSKEMVKKKLESYNLGKEFNYAVAVLKLTVNNGEQSKIDTLKINLGLKVQYITPFVTKELAEAYLQELSGLNMITILLPVNDGKVVTKNDKHRTFTITPAPPYGVDDLWLTDTDDGVLKCKVAKRIGESFNKSDWESMIRYPRPDEISYSNSVQVSKDNGVLILDKNGIVDISHDNDCYGFKAIHSDGTVTIITSKGLK